MDEKKEQDLEARKRALSRISKGESFLRGGSQGATFGFGDELSAGLGALFPTATDRELGRSFSDRYQNIRDTVRTDNKNSEEANPGSYLVGELTGGITTAAVPTGLALKGAGLAKKAANIGTGIAGGMMLDATGRSEKENVVDRVKDGASDVADTGKAIYDLIKENPEVSALAAIYGPLALKNPKAASKLAKQRALVKLTNKEAQAIERAADDIYHVTNKKNLKGILDGIEPKSGEVRELAYGRHVDEDYGQTIPDLVFMSEEPGINYANWSKIRDGLDPVKEAKSLDDFLKEVAVARIERDPDYFRAIDSGGDIKLEPIGKKSMFTEPPENVFTVESDDIITDSRVIPKEVVTDEDVLPYIAKDKELAERLRKRFPEFDEVLENYIKKKDWKEAPISIKPVDEYDFIELLEEAAKKQPKIKEFTTSYKPEEIKDFTRYVSSDGNSGFMIKPDGEITALFSAEKGRGNALVKRAVESGGSKLDAFDGYLPELYKKHGFLEYKREPNWTPGQPDVVYMALPEKHPELFQSLPNAPKLEPFSVNETGAKKKALKRIKKSSR